MQKQVAAYIQKHSLLPDGATVIVGFSGGADSVALLVLQHRLGYRCVAAHCNFHLRGSESDRDEAFAESFARELGIVFEKTDFDTKAFAAENKLSIEMAARELRYQWFEALRLKHNAEAIVVAHHRDDNVETVLLNLIRGCGIKGLTGMSPLNGKVARPLLAVSRCEIEAFLAGENTPFVTDSTNTDTVYQRNAIRHELLPLLEKYNPSVRDALLRATAHLGEVEKVYAHALREQRAVVMPAEGAIDIALLEQQPSPQALLYDILSDYNFTPAVIDSVARSLSSASGKVFFSPSHRVVKDRSRLLISPIDEAREAHYLIDESLTTGHLPLKLRIEKAPYMGQPLVLASANEALFDYDKLSFPLELRRWERGDFFIPFGMKGRQKLSDYFNDHKFSLPEKENTWLLCSAGEVVWIMGHRADNRYRVAKNTENLLHITLY